MVGSIDFNQMHCKDRLDSVLAKPILFFFNLGLSPVLGKDSLCTTHLFLF